MYVFLSNLATYECGGCGLHEACVYCKHTRLTSGGGKESSRHRAHWQRATQEEREKGVFVKSVSVKHVYTHHRQGIVGEIFELLVYCERVKIRNININSALKIYVVL